MKFLRLDSLNKQSSIIGFGGWQAGGLHINQGRSIGWQNVDCKNILAAIETALEIGINVFDTADAYGPDLLSARRIGKALKQVNREDIIVHGKLGYVHSAGPHCFSRANLEIRLSMLLEALELNYLDVLGLHHSDFGNHDRYLNEAVETLEDFKLKGLIRAIGLRFGHKNTSNSRYVSTFRDVIIPHTQLIDKIKPEFCSVNGSFNRPDNMPDFNGIWLINKPLHQGLLITAANQMILGDNRHNKPEFSIENRQILRDIVDKYELSQNELLCGHINRVLDCYNKSIVFVGFRTPSQVLELSAAVNTGTNNNIDECFNEVIAVLRRLKCTNGQS